MLKPDWMTKPLLEEIVDEHGPNGCYCYWCDNQWEGWKAPTECPRCGSGDIVTECGYLLELEG